MYIRGRKTTDLLEDIITRVLLIDLGMEYWK